MRRQSGGKRSAAARRSAKVNSCSLLHWSLKCFLQKWTERSTDNRKTHERVVLLSPPALLAALARLELEEAQVACLINDQNLFNKKCRTCIFWQHVESKMQYMNFLATRVPTQGVQVTVKQVCGNFWCRSNFHL